MNGQAVCAMTLSGYSPEEIGRVHGKYARYLAETGHAVPRLWGSTKWIGSFLSPLVYWCGPSSTSATEEDYYAEYYFAKKKQGTSRT